MAFKNCKFCDDTFLIGCFLHCDEISTGLLSTQAGIHTVSIKFLNAVQQVDVLIDMIGDEIKIPKGLLNESSESIVSIENPDDTTFVHNTGGTDYECFSAQLLITV